MSLSSENRERFIPIIDSILTGSDLQTISEKRIRKGLQEAVGYDLTPQKAPVKQLIMERFDIFVARKGIASSSEKAEPSAATPNGQSQHDHRTSPSVPLSTPQSSSPKKRNVDDGKEPSEEPSKTPPSKKRKSDNDIDADAVLAARLQAEENLRARPTRGARTRKPPPAKKKSKSKTSKKVNAEDDSELESSPETNKKEVNRTGGFHKPLNLSPALSTLLNGEVALSRPQTVKKLWQYIHANDLQDPSDRRQIRCDDAMRAVFKQDRVHMFTMTKILNQNLYSPDE